jgi:excisionase family DNA binding protein
MLMVDWPTIVVAVDLLDLVGATVGRLLFVRSHPHTARWSTPLSFVRSIGYLSRMAESAFVSVAQAAELPGITRQAILKRIRAGRLPATRVGRSYIVPRSALSVRATERDPLVAEIVRRLVHAYDPERVYLFGSAAAGEASADSDFEVLVIVPDAASPDRLRSRRGYEAALGTEGGRRRRRHAPRRLRGARRGADVASGRGARGGRAGGCRATPARRRSPRGSSGPGRTCGQPRSSLTPARREVEAAYRLARRVVEEVSPRGP